MNNKHFLLKCFYSLILLFLVFYRVSFAQTVNPWVEDINFLFHELEIRHADLYHAISEDSLNTLVNELKSNLNGYPEKEIKFELSKLLVNINDGHTGIFLPYAKGLELHRLPLLLRTLENSTIVMNALPEYENLIGKKLRKIGGLEVNDLLPKLYQYIPRDNEYGPQGDGGDYLVISELLEHLGVPKEAGSFICTFEDQSGKMIRQKLHVITAEAFEQIEEPDNQFHSLLWLNTKGQKFWKERIEPDLLYIQLNSSDIGKLEHEIVSFSEEITSESSQKKIKKIVLDLRENHGGSIRRTNPLLEALITVDQLYSDKQLFVLTSKNTFSAAGVLAARLEYLTDAVFVGSPTAWKPNSFGDIGFITLPNSQLRIRYSRLVIHPADEWDARPAVFPDFKAPIKYDHMVNGIDPAIEVIKSYQPKKDFSKVAKQYLEPPNIDKLKETYFDFKGSRFNEYEFGVPVLNNLAITLYQNGYKEAALELFELNVHEYPWSPRAFNNLGEVLLDLGDHERGMYHLKRAFNLHKGYTKWRDLINQDEK